jgi:hypothetical protein
MKVRENLRVREWEQENEGTNRRVKISRDLYLSLDRLELEL